MSRLQQTVLLKFVYFHLFNKAFAFWRFLHIDKLLQVAFKGLNCSTFQLFYVNNVMPSMALGNFCVHALRLFKNLWVALVRWAECHQ